MKTATAKQRVMRVTIPFDGGRVGCIRVTDEQGKVVFYQVVRDEKNADLFAFFKEGPKATVLATHRVDLDMRCCDCSAYRYRAKCRHLSAAQTLRKLGHV